MDVDARMGNPGDYDANGMAGGMQEPSSSGGESSLTQEDAWTVIESFFVQKGLVRQQLDSFDEFIETTMLELIEETPPIVVEPQLQYRPGDQENNNMDEDGPEDGFGASAAGARSGAGSLKQVYKINFGQIYLSKPTHTEAGGDSSPIFPREARLRNLTYSAPLYADVQMTIKTIDTETGEEVGEPTEKPLSKVFMGQIPIMLRSKYCSLYEVSPRDAAELGECEYDQGGYFVINGTEKVLIAQERMASNHVVCFKKRQPHKFSIVSQILSTLEGSSLASSTEVRMYSRGGDRGTAGNVIRVTVPYIRSDIPIVILFRALGFAADKDVLDHIVG